MNSRTDMKRVGTRNCCSRHFWKLIRFFWKSPSSLRRIGFKYSLIDLIVLFLQNFHFLSHFYKFFLLLEAEDLQVFFLLARFFRFFWPQNCSKMTFFGQKSLFGQKYIFCIKNTVVFGTWPQFLTILGGRKSNFGPKIAFFEFFG